MSQNTPFISLITKQLILNSNFENTYKENYRKLFCVAKKMVGDDEVVCDIVQEIFICYYENLQAGKIITSPSSWLLRVTINKSIDWINKQKKYTGLNSDVNNVAAENTQNNEQQYFLLRQAMLKLKPQEIKLLVLYSEGFSYKEIARIGDIKFTSVGKTLARALKKLKTTLNELHYEMY